MGTEAYRAFRERVAEAIKLAAPRPELGSDVAACLTFKRAGMEEALAILDEMVKIAAEKMDEPNG